MANTSRRAVLSAGAISVLASIAGAAIAKPDHWLSTASATTLPHSPDAALLALADQFMVLQLQVDAFDAGTPHTDEDLDALVIAQSEVLDDMAEHSATTMDGHRARACVLADWHGLRDMGAGPSLCDEMRIWPLLRDLIGGIV